MHPWTQLTPSASRRLDFARACGVTDIGTVRRANEDHYLIAAELGLVAVADGMGGHAGGGLASADALEALAHYLRCALGDCTIPGGGAPQLDPDATWSDAGMRAVATLHEALDHANRRIYDTNLAHGRGDGDGMGTTLTGLWQPVPGGPLFAFHVGDSRLYRLRDGELTRLTHDQTLYQQALDAGFTDNLPPRNLLLQALGPAPAIAPEVLAHAAAPGDLYLLCSDGLHGACTDDRIAGLLLGAAVDELPQRCAALVDTAKHEGSRDNITAVLVPCPR